MANRIKGITVEIGGNTTKLQTALQGVNKEIKSTQSQLKDMEKLLKLDPGNTELLAQKQQLISSAVKEAASYFNIGVKKMRRLAEEHTSSFSIYSGNRYLIIRTKFEEFLVETSTI